MAAAARRLRATAAVLAQLDVLAALADLARQRGYCRPTMVDEPVLQIVDGRHPVLDAMHARGDVRAQRRGRPAARQARSC